MDEPSQILPPDVEATAMKFTVIGKSVAFVKFCEGIISVPRVMFSPSIPKGGSHDHDMVAPGVGEVSVTGKVALPEQIVWFCCEN